MTGCARRGGLRQRRRLSRTAERHRAEIRQTVGTLDMSSGTSDLVNSVRRLRRLDAGLHPPPDSPAYRSTALRHPKQPLVIIPQSLSELSGALYGDDAVGPLITISRPQHAASAVRPAHRDRRACARRGRASGAAHAHRSVAGQRRRPVRARGRPVGCAAGSELQRRRPRADRRRRAISRSSPFARAPTRGAITTMPGVRRTSTSRCLARPS